MPKGKSPWGNLQGLYNNYHEIFQRCSHFPYKLSFDSTVDHEWPETPDQPPTPPLSPPPPAQLERESTPCTYLLIEMPYTNVYWLMIGETLQDLEDQRRFAVSVIVRRIVWADMYAHLPNVELDWELEGRLCCRVIGTKCYGQMIEGIERHLQTVYHIVSQV